MTLTDEPTDYRTRDELDSLLTALDELATAVARGRYLTLTAVKMLDHEVVECAVADLFDVDEGGQALLVGDVWCEDEQFRQLLAVDTNHPEPGTHTLCFADGKFTVVPADGAVFVRAGF